MTQTPDWADGQASRFLETQDMPLSTREVDRIVLASALRKAKAAGMREAEKVAYVAWKNKMDIGEAIRAAADDLEKGEA